jgi:dCMP deaminase
MKEKYFNMYMCMAEAVSQQSCAVRKKVGCVIVSPQDLVTYGWNGKPSGWDNNCENQTRISPPEYVTQQEVLHAESNALMKAAREGFALKGGVMFVTCSPCFDCAKLIHQAGIKEVFYKEVYRSTDGIEFLRKCGIEVKQLNN